MRIDVKQISSDREDVEKPTEVATKNSETPIDVRLTKSYIILSLPEHQQGTNIEVVTENRSIFSGSIGKKGEIKIDRSTSIAKEIIKIINRGEMIFAKLK